MICAALEAEPAGSKPPKALREPDMTKDNMAMRRVDDPQEVGAPFTFLVPIIQLAGQFVSPIWFVLRILCRSA